MPPGAGIRQTRLFPDVRERSRPRARQPAFAVRRPLVRLVVLMIGTAGVGPNHAGPAAAEDSGFADAGLIMGDHMHHT